jgi:pimeloyl-ACP methyl ester carboxylesterase
VRSFALLARGSLHRDREYDRYVSEIETLLESARSGAPPGREGETNQLAARLAPLIVSERTQVILGTKGLSGPQFFRLLSSPRLDISLSWDPRHVVPLVMCPVLVLYGAKDVQVPASENMAAARALVHADGKSDWTIREIAGMNHAFQRCETGTPDEYAAIGHVMADEVVEEVAAWIGARTRA